MSPFVSCRFFSRLARWVVRAIGWRPWSGKGGALFHAIDVATGDTLTEYPPSPPVFDGLIAAGGHVFLVTMGGRLRAFAGD